jgi:lytic murein transglycosylase B
VALSTTAAQDAAAAPRWRERLRQLPRDTRDTLFHLGVIGWTIAPHLLHLPVWCAVMVLAMLGWRARLALRGGTLPGRGWVVALLALATALTVWSQGTLLGREPGVTLLVVLMALKTLELRARRDALVIFFLGFFLVLTHFLYSQSLGTGLWMLVAVWALLTALVLAHMPVGRPPLARAGALAARAALLGVPVMVVLFVLFPRIGPLWGLPQDAAGRTGLSGTMRLGGVAELANDDSIALRVRFQGAAPPQSQMYFRGPVLGSFDGREWTRLVPTFPAALRPRADLELIGPGLRYEMTLEPSRLPMLPLLEATPDMAGSGPQLEGWMLTLRPDLQWQTDRPVAERLRVTATAWPAHRHGPRQEVVGLRDLVELPPGYNPRTLAWAAELRNRPELQQADSAALVDAVLAHIRSAGFSYTLQPGSYGRDAVDEFWLDRRVGFCEHYAAAFVVILRALDIPARIVTGYMGTDPQPVDGWWVVRQRHAHAWAEYWQAGRGWVRVDPTAAVAPDRVERGSSLAPQAGLVGGALRTLDPEMAERLRAGWEALNNRWNQWVLNYSRGQQFELLRWLGIDAPSWHDLAVALLALLCTAAAGGAGWAWWDRQRQDPWQRLQARVAARLAALGAAVAMHDAPRQRAQRVRAALGAAGEPLAALLDTLDRQRYATAAPLPARLLRDWQRQFDTAARALPRRTSPMPAPKPGGGASGGTAAAALAVATVLGWMAAAALLPDTAQAARPAASAPPTSTASSTSGPAYGQRDDVQAFAADLAARRALDPAWVAAQLARAQRVAAVQRLIMPPPAGTARNWAAYRARFIEPRRIAAGLAFWRANEAVFARAEAEFGAPAAVVASIIGVETFYGQVMGSFRVIDALATLAFDFPPGRRDRSDFFRGELEEFLLWCQATGTDPQLPRGSFAGAMGLPQFMPGSIARFGVDFDGDGRIDLTRSAPDAIGSVARYLAAFGWQRGMPTHFTVAAPVDTADRAALLAPDIRPSFTAGQMTALGAELEPAGRAHDGLLALVELQNGERAPTFVAGTQNFWAITRYNWSSYYAMAVIDLAAALQAARDAGR